MILSTKFTPQIANEQSAQPVSDMLEASLGRLGVDAIDFYWIHNPLDVEKWTPGLIPLYKAVRSNASVFPTTIWHKSDAPTKL